MSQIKSTELIREVIDVARLGPMDERPSKLFNSVMPVIDVNPKHSRICDIVRQNDASTTGTTQVFLTPTGMDFFLTGFILQGMDNATADSTTLRLTAVIDGATRDLANLQKLTTTAWEDSVSCQLSVPIKIDRNTAINLIKTFTVGAARSSATVFGFTVNNY